MIRCRVVDIIFSIVYILYSNPDSTLELVNGI
jgi:hypothetical protein